MISSLANTVPRASHQLTLTSDWLARPTLTNLRNIHCVQRTYASSVVASSLSQSYEKPRLLSWRLKFAMFSYVVTLNEQVEEKEEDEEEDGGNIR